MIQFYIETAQQYVEMSKLATDRYSKEVWLEYAQYFLQKAEQKLEEEPCHTFVPFRNKMI